MQIYLLEPSARINDLIPAENIKMQIIKYNFGRIKIFARLMILTPAESIFNRLI